MILLIITYTNFCNILNQKHSIDITVEEFKALNEPTQYSIDLFHCKHMHQCINYKNMNCLVYENAKSKFNPQTGTIY